MASLFVASSVHAMDGSLHTGTITDAQHAVRALANAHAHANISGITPNDHHLQLHQASHASAGGDAFPHQAQHLSTGTDQPIHAASHTPAGNDIDLASVLLAFVGL